MKRVDWKTLCITCLVCFVPVLLGIAMWEQLPESMAIHFNIHNEADNFAPKWFVVFGMPAMMAFLQLFCCVINDIKAHEYGERKKFERVLKWIIPLMSIVLHSITVGYSLGWDVDIRRAVQIILGVTFIAIGNYLPKFDTFRVTPKIQLKAEQARKVNRFMGYEMVLLGILSFACAFLPTIASVIWLFLLIPYTAISIWYGVKVYKG